RPSGILSERWRRSQTNPSSANIWEMFSGNLARELKPERIGKQHLIWMYRTGLCSVSAKNWLVESAMDLDPLSWSFRVGKLQVFLCFALMSGGPSMAHEPDMMSA